MMGPRCRCSLACIVLAVGCSSDPYRADAYNGYPLNEPAARPTVVWQRADGSAYDVARETNGRVTLLFFGYSHCPDICPLQLANIATALRKLGADTAAMVRVLVVSIDPARDTGAVFDRWVRTIDSNFIALRGPMPSVVAEMARLGFATPARLAGDSTSVDPAHASAVIVFARDDRAHFMYRENVNAEAWAHDLRSYLRESRP